MPYVEQEARDRLDGPGEDRQANHPQSVGELTYDLQRCLRRYLEDHGLRYQQLAECLGALEGAKQDLIQRVVTPYEEEKCEANGDVWPAELTDGLVPLHAVSDSLIGGSNDSYDV